MIAQLRGVVERFWATSVILDVHGVGYLVHCPAPTLATLRLGQEVTLATSLIVREDSMTMYGFASGEDRDMFELVQTASGVGPKVAHAMLSVLDADRIASAIASADHATLTQVPGIGKKGAERIVLELKDKVGRIASVTTTGGDSWRPTVRDALVSLGWNLKVAENAMDTVAREHDDLDVQTALKLALQSLAKDR